MKTMEWVRAEPGRVRNTSWKEYLIRFAFGGIITAAVGIIGKAYGPVVAGLFLAFPAILPASLTLTASHDGTRAAGADALGAAVGSVGLAAFGIVIWYGASRGPAWLVLTAASIAWLAVSLAIWAILIALQRIRGRRESGRLVDHF